MSFLLENDIQKAYICKINQEIKILRSSKIDWTIEDVIRFTNLIKIDDAVSDIIKSYQIDGNKLFDIEYLSSNLEAIITQRNFMPLYKLFYIVTAILNLTEPPLKDINPAQKRLPQKHIQKAWIIDIDEYLITKLKQQLLKLNQIKILQLGSNQLYRILKNLSMNEQSQLIKKWNIDGFSLICIIGNQQQQQTYKNYYSEEQILLLVRLSNIFLHVYYYQISLEKLQKYNFIDDVKSFQIFDINFNHGEINVKKSIVKSQFGISQECSDDGDFRQEDVQTKYNSPLRTSEYGVSIAQSYLECNQPLRNSEYGQSVAEGLQHSSYDVSQRGSIKNSEYNTSQRGSLAQSMAQSMTESMYLTSSIIDEQATKHSKDKEQSNKIVISSIEDEQNINILILSSLNLPFNLLDLQPLHKIKVSVISYPFNIIKAPSSKKQLVNSNEILSIQNSSQKAQSIYDLIEENENIRQFKIFNLTGCKFGRNPQNDFNFPDELSISGKHAQILFKDDSYYIRDLGSKTGTFLYISQRKPLILMDEQIVQLSYEVQFKVAIVKNDINEGIIKFQFKKPQNEPPYRAILKNNNTVRIGKSQKSHIKLLSQSISSNHAQIKYEQGKFMMYDCNTRTGTWLRLSSKGVRSIDKKLSKQDIIRISSKKTFFIEDISQSIKLD